MPVYKTTYYILIRMAHLLLSATFSSVQDENITLKTLIAKKTIDCFRKALRYERINNDETGLNILIQTANMKFLRESQDKNANMDEVMDKINKRKQIDLVYGNFISKEELKTMALIIVQFLCANDDEFKYIPELRELNMFLKQEVI